MTFSQLCEAIRKATEESAGEVCPNKIHLPVYKIHAATEPKEWDVFFTCSP